MAQLLNHALPGEIITAEEWNLVVDAVNQLLQSTQTNRIKINAMLPAGTVDQALKIGALVQVVGENFGFTIGQSKVTFEAGAITATVLRANMLEGSSDQTLLFIMPPIPTITPAGMTMTMHVSNGVAEDTKSIFVKPIVISLSGNVFVSWRANAPPNPNPNPLQSGAGKSAEFRYQIQSGTNMPATFDLSADLLNASVALPPGLVSSIEFRDDANQLIPGKKLEMGKNETRNVTIRIPEIPTAMAAASFSLKVTATSGTVVGTDQRPFTVGAAVTPPDANIEVIQGTPVVFNTNTGDFETDPANGRLDGSTIKLKPNRQMVIGFNVTLKASGNYDLTVLPKQGTTLANWQLEVIDTQNPFQQPNQGDLISKFMQIGVTAKPSAAASGTLTFRIKRQGANSDWFKEFDVQAL